MLMVGITNITNYHAQHMYQEERWTTIILSIPPLDWNFVLKVKSDWHLRLTSNSESELVWLAKPKMISFVRRICV